VFDDTTVHEFALEIPDDSWDALSGGWGHTATNEYYEATFTGMGEKLEVGIRLKGSSTWQGIDQKPNFKIKFDEFVEDQELEDADCFDLHNEMYDPSYMKEFLAYKAFREAGLPASRTGWAHLTVNGEDYGLYGIIEKEDGRYLKQWFDDTTGSVYEAVGCDLTNTACWELDSEGDADDADALAELQHAASRASGWYDSIQDGDRLARRVAEPRARDVDCPLGRLRRQPQQHPLLPRADRRSLVLHAVVDRPRVRVQPLARREPYCGKYMTNPADYQSGLMVTNAVTTPIAATIWTTAFLEMADHLEAIDLVSEIERVAPILRDYAASDPKNNFGEDRIDDEIDCLEDWISARPESCATTSNDAAVEVAFEERYKKACSSSPCSRSSPGPPPHSVTCASSADSTTPGSW
jgi:hypothetical protein